ncbi:MAG: exodeoxyribonuclease VII large subunit, partial [Rickettsiaceae bacterium]|nr:exodeoxyribonuclease VII large subunit [Rickettsiaceae bacterium]
MQLTINFDDKAKGQEVKQYSVTEISQLLKNTIEERFLKVKIEGEISGYKLASTGHAYFNIKDDN